MDYRFRKAEMIEIKPIWEIIAGAILRRKQDGSNQWQDGYPNLKVIKNDIDNGYGFVLTEENAIIAYCAILVNDEPEYQKIKGSWITTNKDFFVVHRIAISKTYLGKGFAQKLLTNIEYFALKKEIYSIRADTNYDNIPMLRIFEKMNYIFCGYVYFRGGERKAFEKVLDSPF